jgi:WD40 repeat protein
MDSRLLAIGYRDGLIRLCRVSSGEELFHYRMRSRPVSQLAFSNDGTTLIAADGDSSVQVLDLRELQQHLTPIALAW